MSATTPLTCFPLACFDVHHCSVVLFCEVFEQDHLVPLIGVVNKHRLGAHTQHLTETGESQRGLESHKAQDWVYAVVQPYTVEIPTQWCVFHLPQGIPQAPAG